MWQDVKLLNAIANVFFGLVLIAMLASGVWWVIHRPYFSLTAVKVEKENGSDLKHVNVLTVRDQALPKISGNFFTADLNNIRTAFESVPWVKKASVQRVWPDRLSVIVEEHEVLGTWGEDGRLISVTGDVFAANLAEAEEDVQLIAFSGPEGSEKEVVTQYRLFKEWFSVVGLSPDQVVYSGRYAWTVRFNTGLKLELGKAQDETSLKKRVEQLIKVYPQLLARLQDNIESIDMRYPNGLALKTSHSAPELGSKQVPVLR
jgi:cell division protein FtsQ